MLPRCDHHYPRHVIDERALISRTGSFRQRVQYDLIDRPYYIFGLLTAADIAKCFNIHKITAIEFGVANGEGLFNLCELAPLVTEVTSVEFDIIGFDNAAGLPAPVDYRDHPEIWSPGDFTMKNREEIESKLPHFARLIIGDVKDTLQDVVKNITDEAPVGFVAHDMDLYSSTKACFSLYEGVAAQLLPVSIAYFDDTIGHPARVGSLYRNQWCGQLLAIKEFNESHSFRKIDVIRTLKHRRPMNKELWLDQIYAVHALDHPSRNQTIRNHKLSIDDHLTSTAFEWPL